MTAQTCTAATAAGSTRWVAAAAWPRLVAAGLVLGLLAFGPAPDARAQDQSLIGEVKRLQRELNTLQRYVYKGEQPPASAITSVYGTEGAVSQTQAARLELRLSQLEAELRGLTGSIEEQSFRVDRLNRRMDKLVADMDARLRRLEERTGGRPPAPAFVAGGAQERAPGTPGTLGTVSADAVAALRAQGVETGSGAATSGDAAPYVLPEGTPESRYKHAFGLLSQANYREAERALSAFLLQHPDHRLAGNAKYWLGETYYVRGQYQDAAITFAEGYQQYPGNTKAPDNLLKLGKSLAALGEKTDACGTYSELIRRFPNASATIQQQAKRERRRLGCP